MNNKINNQGFVSIMVVIMIMTFLVVAMTILNIAKFTFIKNEAQGIMDNAGVMALRHAIDETQWREERIVVDKPVARAKFIELVNKQFEKDLSGMIDDYTIREVNVYNKNITKQGKGEYYIESVIEIDYPSVSFIVDTMSASAHTFYNFFTGNDDVRMVTGEQFDGTGETVVRSVSRMALR